MLKEGTLSPTAKGALPANSIKQLQTYKQLAGLWHEWEAYFPFLQYRVLSMSEEELQQVHGVEEGLEYRIKRTARTSPDFQTWMEKLKTKRYTWTRLQRTFVHILLHTTKQSIAGFLSHNQMPYIRLLGMSEQGRSYLNIKKKKLDVPVIGQLKKEKHPMLEIDLRASYVYYSILPSATRMHLQQQEFLPPYMAR